MLTDGFIEFVFWLVLPVAATLGALTWLGVVRWL